MNKKDSSRRNFIKKAAYVAPAIMTLTAVPAFAARGSDRRPQPRPPRGKDKHGRDQD